MNTNNEQFSHEQAAGLLPWYVNRSLDDAEKSLVELHLAGCARCRAAVDELEVIGRAILKGAPTPLVPAADAERLNTLIDAETRSDQGRRYGLAAAVVLAAAAGVFLLSLDADRVSPGFETATSSAGGAAMHYVVLVEVAPNVPAADRERAFDSIGLADAVATRDADVYRGVLSLPATSVTELESIQLQLAERPEIRGVRVVALQLPVERPR